MQSQEETLRQQYATLWAAFQTAFPTINPPDSSWWSLWLRKYEFCDIRDAIQQLSKHPLKSKFTTISTGKALSALLRESALRRAIADVTQAVKS